MYIIVTNNLSHESHSQCLRQFSLLFFSLGVMCCSVIQASYYDILKVNGIYKASYPWINKPPLEIILLLAAETKSNSISNFITSYDKLYHFQSKGLALKFIFRLFSIYKQFLEKLLLGLHGSSFMHTVMCTYIYLGIISLWNKQICVFFFFLVVYLHNPVPSEYTFIFCPVIFLCFFLLGSYWRSWRTLLRLPCRL